MTTRSSTASAAGADLGGVHTGATTADGFATGSLGGVVVEAVSSEDVVGLAIAGGGGTVGVAGAVDVVVLNVLTKAWVGDRVSVNGTSQLLADPGQSVTVVAADRLHSFTLGGGVAGGYVGVAGGIDIGVSHADTQAWIGSAAHVNAKNDIGVYALSKKDVLTLAISAAGGFVGVSGSVSVWTIGASSNGKYDDGSYDAAKDKGNWAPGTTYTEGDIVTASDGNRYVLRDVTDDADTGTAGYQADISLGQNPTTHPDQWGRIDDDALSSENGSAQDQAGDSADGNDSASGYKQMVDGISDDSSTNRTSQRMTAAKATTRSSINASAPGHGVVGGSMSAAPSGGTMATVGSNAVLERGRRHRRPSPTSG